jgi:predicted aspartyl protease
MRSKQLATGTVLSGEHPKALSLLAERVRWCCAFLFTLCTAVFASAAEKSQIESEFPFDLRDGFICVKVTAKESSTPLNFILDSGAAVSTLNSDSAKRLGLHGGERVTVKGVGSSTVGHWPQRLNAQVDSLHLSKSYLVVDLCNLQASCQCRVDGLIGADFFDGKIVQMDFAARKIRLLRSTETVSGDVIQLKKRRGIWQVPLNVNDSVIAWFRLDTGCATPLQWVTASAPKTSSSKITVALAEMSLPVTETTVQLGGMKLSQMPATIHRSEIFSGEAGLIGVGLLSRFSSVTIDGKANRLILTPAARH